jgi:hypothetical protein
MCSPARRSTSATANSIRPSTRALRRRRSRRHRGGLPRCPCRRHPLRRARVLARRPATRLAAPGRERRDRLNAFGLALWRRRDSARAYALGFGAVYLVVTIWGFVTGDQVLWLLPVDLQQRPYSSSLPYRAGAQRFIVGALPHPDSPRPAGETELERVRTAAATGRLRFQLAVAAPMGRFTPVAELNVGPPLPSPRRRAPLPPAEWRRRSRAAGAVERDAPLCVSDVPVGMGTDPPRRGSNATRSRALERRERAVIQPPRPFVSVRREQRRDPGSAGVRKWTGGHAQMRLWGSSPDDGGVRGEREAWRLGPGRGRRRIRGTRRHGDRRDSRDQRYL